MNLKTIEISEGDLQSILESDLKELNNKIEKSGTWVTWTKEGRKEILDKILQISEKITEIGKKIADFDGK